MIHLYLNILIAIKNNVLQIIIPAKERRLMYEQMKIVFRADFTVTIVNRAFETPCSFATHL